MRGYETTKIYPNEWSSIQWRTVYFCPKCKRAWQKPHGENRVEYYPKHIFGDKDKICPNCSRG